MTAEQGILDTQGVQALVALLKLLDVYLQAALLLPQLVGADAAEAGGYEEVDDHEGRHRQHYARRR